MCRGSVTGTFDRRGVTATLKQAQSAELRVEELLETLARLRLVGVPRVVEETVGEHQLHVGDELTCRGGHTQTTD